MSSVRILVLILTTATKGNVKAERIKNSGARFSPRIVETCFARVPQRNAHLVRLIVRNRAQILSEPSLVAKHARLLQGNIN